MMKIIMNKIEKNKSNIMKVGFDIEIRACNVLCVDDLF